MLTSTFKANYPNWKNGENDVFHEREPQYPVYSLPFRGKTTNLLTYTDGKIDL